MLNIGDTVRVLPFEEIDRSFPAVDEAYGNSDCFGIDDYCINSCAAEGSVVVSDVKRDYRLTSGKVDIYRLKRENGKDLPYWWLEGMIVLAEDDFDPSAAGDEDGLIGFLLGTAPSKDK